MLLSRKLGLAACTSRNHTPLCTPSIKGSSNGAPSASMRAASGVRCPARSSLAAQKRDAGNTRNRTTLRAVADLIPAVKDDRIPVTASGVITGFLGSGKTTLLNHVLTSSHGKRIAVIENEFGEIDIDSELVARTEVLEGTGESIMQLANGCLCCTVRDDLVRVLNSLWERRGEFDHILIETTGLANPGPIISSFYMDQQLPGRVRLDGVVTVVDARHVGLRLDERDAAPGAVSEAVEQIAYADRIVLNKTDLVDGADLAAVQQRLRAINSLAEMAPAQRAVVPLDYVLGVGGFELERVEKQVAAAAAHTHEHDHECSDPDCTHESHNHAHAHSHDHAHECSDPDCTHESHNHSHAHSHAHNHAHAHDHECGGADCTHESHAHDHDHSHAHTHAAAPAAPVHDDRVTSCSFTVEGEMDLDKINFTMGMLLNERGEDLYRVKGILAIEGMPERYVFQAVHMLFEGTPDRAWRQGEKRVSRMVFIGRDIDADAFQEAFTRCLAAPQPAGAAR